MKYLILLLFILGAFTVSGYTMQGQQIMVTPNSYVEDKDGNEITYEVFVKQMNTGKFIPKPIHNDDGEHMGFRLMPKESSSDSRPKEPSIGLKLESTQIQEEQKLEFIYRDYLFAPVEFFNGQVWTTKWMVFDTGTFIPLIILPEVAEEIGPVQKVKIGEVEVFEPPVGSYEFNDLIRNLNRYRDRYPDEFGKNEIVGIAGLPLLSNYLISIQTNTGEVTLRPIDSEQRTFYSEPPIAQVRYRFEQGNIWFPVTINGKEGFAHLDTGNPFFDIDSDAISTKNHSVDSYIVGDLDLANYLTEIETRSESLSPRYKGLQIEVISAFGNLAATPFLITIDPLEKKIYFEKSKGL